MRLLQMYFALSLTAAVTVTYSCYAAANTFGDRDYQLLRSLSAKVEVFQRDILDSRRELLHQANIYECMSNMSHDLEGVNSNVSELTTLVSINALMVDSFDESVVKRYIYENITQGLNLLQLSRRSVNLSGGQCSNGAIVTTKVQYILGLFTEIENALHLLVRR